MSDISEKAIKLIKDLRRDISIDIMFTPEKNAEDDSLKALVDYIAELEAAQRWIPVSERLPEPNQSVLVFDRLGDMTIDFLVTFNREGVAYYTNSDDGAVCWMPLPEPPEVQE